MVKKLDDKAAIAAVKVLVGSSHLACSYQYPAVRDLVLHARSKSDVVSVTIRLLIAKWRASLSRPSFMQNYDALAFAIELLDECKTSRGLADAVIKAAAEAGFIGRFPNLPRRLLKRHPDRQEITLLISAYVNNKGSSSKDTEERLEQLARMYLSEEDAEREIARIRAFQSEWMKNVD